MKSLMLLLVLLFVPFVGFADSTEDACLEKTLSKKMPESLQKSYFENCLAETKAEPILDGPAQDRAAHSARLEAENERRRGAVGQTINQWQGASKTISNAFIRKTPKRIYCLSSSPYSGTTETECEQR